MKKYAQLKVVLSLLGGAFIPLIRCSTKVTTEYYVHITDRTKPITIFSHGIGGSHKQGLRYKTLFSGFDLESVNYIVFDYPDAPEKFFEKNPHTGLAQESEMIALDGAIEKVLEQINELEIENPKVILFGVSRGASTIINVLGRRIKERKKLPNIVAVILESPFAHCEDTLEGYATLFSLPQFFMRFLAKRFFKEYDSCKNAPIDWLKEVTEQIPFLFICTEQDTVVPVKSTKKLGSFRQEICQDTYLHAFKEGIHANLIWSAFGEEYAWQLHAFYRFCGLPCDERLADLGSDMFEKSQVKKEEELSEEENKK